MSQSLIARRYDLLSVLPQTVIACCVVGKSCRTPNLTAMRKACDEIKAFIPTSEHCKLDDPKDDPKYKTPFSSGVAEVLAWLNLLDDQIAFPPANELVAAVESAVVGAVNICSLALRQQMENDEKFTMSAPTTM